MSTNIAPVPGHYPYMAPRAAGDLTGVVSIVTRGWLKGHQGVHSKHKQKLKNTPEKWREMWSFGNILVIYKLHFVTILIIRYMIYIDKI